MHWTLVLVFNVFFQVVVGCGASSWNVRRSGGQLLPAGPRQRTAAPITNEEMYFDTEDEEEQATASASSPTVSIGVTGSSAGGPLPSYGSSSVPIVAAPGGAFGGPSSPHSPHSPGRPSSPPLGGGRRSPTFAGFSMAVRASHTRANAHTHAHTHKHSLQLCFLWA